MPIAVCKSITPHSFHSSLKFDEKPLYATLVLKRNGKKSGANQNSLKVVNTTFSSHRLSQKVIWLSLTSVGQINTILLGEATNSGTCF